MKNWSIKKKLGFLSFWLLMMICVVSFIGARGTSRITARLNGIVDVNLPAVHTAALLNSVDDELRTAAYQAILANTEKDREGLRKAESEFNHFRDESHKYLGKMAALQLDADTQKAVAEVAPLMKAYVGSVEQVVLAAQGDQRQAALAKMAALHHEFQALDAKLDVLEKKIVELSEGDKQTAQADGTFYSRLSGTIVFVSLFIGLFLAYWIVRELTSTLSGIIDRLSESSGKVSYASTQSSRTATSLSESATEQAAGLQETMALAEEISAMVDQNAESANRAKTAVDQSEQDSVQGAQSVAEMLSAIGEIKRTNDEILGQMEESNREFGNIVKIIGEIEDKTKVINDIVFQTKLLSFNASVEAARAGEHGKGFAVVAEEVGNLAQMSGNAAKEITDMLGSSVRRVNEIVSQTTRKVDSLMEVGRDKIAQGQLTAQRCRDVLDQISKSAKTVSGMVAEISAASKEQAQGVSEISKAIAQLDQVTQNNSAVSQESATQAGQLESEANHLLETVSRLAATVRGGGARVTTSSVAVKAKPPAKAKATTKAAPKTQEATAQTNVIPMSRPKSGASVASAKVARPAKRVVGGSEVPSGDDPHFEEF